MSKKEKLEQMTEANGCTPEEASTARRLIERLYGKQADTEDVTHSGIPHNALTGAYYGGSNVKTLMDAGYTSGKWATYRQWASLGRQVNKGEKSTKCRKFGEKKDKKTGKSKSFFAGFSLFNISQVSRVDGDQTPELPNNCQNTAAEPKAAKPEAPRQEPASLSDYYMDASVSFTAKAEPKLAPRQTNTPKRMKQASKSTLEGLQLERAALLAAGLLNHSVKYTKKQILEAATKRTEVGDGYYGLYSEGVEWLYTDSVHVELRSFLADTGPSVDIQQQNKANELRNTKIDGFFPTPECVIDQLFDLIGNMNGKTVLEPSCGMGDMVQRAINEGASVSAYEINRELAEYTTESTGNLVSCADCLELSPIPFYDLVIMNPPYERKKGIGYQYLAHIEHMRKFLKDGGELWAIIPQGSDFNGDCYWDVSGTPFEHTNIKTKIVRVCL